MKHLFLGLWCLGCLLLSGLAQAQSKLLSNFASNAVTTPHVRAELMAYAPDGVQPGKPFTLGLQMQHQPGWHTYWKNAGDSGLPTELTWTLDSGLTAGGIQWPTPQKIPVGNLANYGFEGAVLLAVPVTVAAALPESQTHVTIVLKAQWLVCKTECIPEAGEFALKVPVRGSTALNRGLFESAQNSVPSVGLGAASFAPSEKTLKLVVSGLPAKWVGQPLEAFPENGEIIETAAQLTQSWSKGDWTAHIPLSPQRNSSAAGNPTTMTWLVKRAGGQNHPAVRVSATLVGAWPAALVAAPLAPSAALDPALEAALAAAVANNKTTLAATWTSAAFGLAVLGAVLGGLILNLMPCVLPVLAIKLLSFAPPTQPTAPRRSVRASSALFAVGVVGSFVLLGMALLALRTAGQSWGWGFQLQSPPMVMALAVLFLLIGLNLLDVFDVRALVPSQWVNFHSNNPNIEALASGALAVLIATPCTAPFMGASLGLAVTLPALQALLIFFALGVGMALPFIAIAACPPLGAWLQKMLPKPGRWMSVLRRCLAVPMFVTAVWLLWVYVQQSSVKSAPVSVSAVSPWTDWRADVQAAAIARGQPVFVDFTAAWCITCQVNKSTTLGHSAVQAAFKTKNVLLLRADWTGPDAAIAAELARLGRSGLPVYALYVPGASTPQLLPEVLTIRVLEDALARL